MRGYNKWSHAVPISTVPAGRSPADEASQQCDALGIVDHLGQGVQPARLHQRRKKENRHQARDSQATDFPTRTFFGSLSLAAQIFRFVPGPAHPANSFCEIVNGITWSPGSHVRI